jgi:phosphatidylethanolamine-binding protein (PEBP) family uncharacterized protein
MSYQDFVDRMTKIYHHRFDDDGIIGGASSNFMKDGGVECMKMRKFVEKFGKENNHPFDLHFEQNKSFCHVTITYIPRDDLSYIARR